MFDWLFGTGRRPATPREELASVRKDLRRQDRQLNREVERAQMEAEAATILAENATYEGKEHLARMHAAKAQRKLKAVRNTTILQAQIDEQMQASVAQETYAMIQEATKRQTRAVVREARSLSPEASAHMLMAYTQATEILRTRKDAIHDVNETILEDVEGDEDLDLEGAEEMIQGMIDHKDLEQLGEVMVPHTAANRARSGRESIV